MLTTHDYLMAPCLQDSPIAQRAAHLIETARALGDHPGASLLRVYSVPILFNRMEQIFASGDEPKAGFNQLFHEVAAFYQTAAANHIIEALALYRTEDDSEIVPDNVIAVTGQHYGRLFSGFSHTSYWDEPRKLLKDRLERNHVDLSRLGESIVLDAGCGGGRYTVAWKLLGAKAAVGLDASPIGIADAQRRVQEAGIENVHFQKGNALDLPFKDNSFDVVYSNGVLHHTTDWKQGVHENYRVLKPGGLGWLYLIENPGGLFWDMIEIMRVILKDESHDFARRVLLAMRVPANRVFYMLDHVLVPINQRLTPHEVEAELFAVGAINIRRLTRGADFDRVEQIYKSEPYATAKFGVGENRYVYSK